MRMRRLAARLMLLALAGGAIACATTGTASWLKRQHRGQHAPALRLRPSGPGEAAR